MAMTISGMVNSGFNVSKFFPNSSTNHNAAQKSISNLWSAYGSAQNNAAANAAALQEVRTNASALVASYDDAKKAFYNEFDTNMEDLSESAKSVKDFDFKSVAQAFSAASKVVEAATEAAETSQAATAEQDASSKTENVNTEAFSAAAKVVEAATEVKEKAETSQADTTNANKAHLAKGNAVKTTANVETSDEVVNADGSVTTTNANGDKITSIMNGAITRTETYDSEGNKKIETAYSKVVQSALKTIQDFVDNYNESMEFFKENSGVSSRVGRMAEVFGDTTYNAQIYQSIGINVGNDATLSLDEEKFAKAVLTNPEKVSNVTEGLADKAKQHVDFANFQRNQAFPGPQAMFKDELTMAAFYNSNAYVNMNSYSNLGNLVNMMW
jgi:hypothetical protein